MAQERRHKSRSRRRRGRFGFFYKLLSVLLVAAALTTACVVFFRVNNITVIGNSRYTVQEVIEASGIQQGDNLITLSPSRWPPEFGCGCPMSARYLSVGRYQIRWCWK